MRRPPGGAAGPETAARPGRGEADQARAGNELLARWIWWIERDDRVSVVRAYREPGRVRIESWFDRLDSADPPSAIEFVAPDEFEDWAARAARLMDRLGARLLLHSDLTGASAATVRRASSPRPRSPAR